jgi:Fur family zinc uptake transcriptional regulator
MAHSHTDHSHDQPAALTRNQSLVLSVLNGADAPLSAYEVLDQLRGEGLRAPLQIYRALEKLVERGLAHRLESLNAFVCCANSAGHRTGVIAFAICERCGRVDEFTDQVVRERLVSWADAHRFEARRPTIELRGTCAACAASD